MANGSSRSLRANRQSEVRATRTISSRPRRWSESRPNGTDAPVFDTASSTGYYEWPGGIQSPDNPIAIPRVGHRSWDNARSIGNVHGQLQCPIPRRTPAQCEPRVRPESGGIASRSVRASCILSRKAGTRRVLTQQRRADEPGTGDLPQLQRRQRAWSPQRRCERPATPIRKSTGSTRSSTSGA